MSSATSIDGHSDAAMDARDRVHPTTDGFRPIHFFVLASLVAATAAVVLSRNPNPAHLVLISLTIAAAGLASAGVYRMLAPLVTPEAVAAARDPLSARARRATEREKALVLRSLKELEFDRAMGKLSERDFEEMSGRLRARAVSLMKQLQLETGGYASMVERDLQARLSATPAAGAPVRQGLPPDDGSRAVGVAAVRVCAACDTANDQDAAFCKRCGARVA